MSNPKSWLGLGLIYHFRINKRKDVWGFEAREASFMET